MFVDIKSMFYNNKFTRLFTLLKEWECKSNYFVSVVKKVGEDDEFSQKNLQRGFSWDSNHGATSA
jgi:hypothetical protein